MIFTSRTPLTAGGATAASAATMRRPVTPPTAPPCAPRRWRSAPLPRRTSSTSGGRATVVAPRPATARPSSSSATSSLALLDRDPALRPFEDHLAYRWRRYTEAKAAIAAAVDGASDANAAAEPPLLEFANAYRTWGLQHDATNKRVTFREWIPGASAVALIGDFNGWQPRDALDWAKRDDFGVWTLELPDNQDGTPAIAHSSRYKLRVQSARGGWWADRVSSWARYAVAPQGQMGATFDGVAWWPEEEGGGEAYQWRHPRPAPLPASSAGSQDGPALRIYEAHVGMSSEREEVASYAYFADEVLPRVAAQGYNAIQLMAIQEHAYYASFGYHVTSPFAVASRSGTPEDLKRLIDTAHGLGLRVLLDVIHSHASKNEADGVAGLDLSGGQSGNDDVASALVRSGAAGYHAQWDSRVFSYERLETQRYLLANLRYWCEQVGFDGFRFDGVTSMLYHHHGAGVGFSGGYHEYFGTHTDVEACVYLMLANEMLHSLPPAAGGGGASSAGGENKRSSSSSSSSSSSPPPPTDVLTIAEDVSGMPGLCSPVEEGGLGFDARLAMAAPDLWIRLLKHVPDEHWPVSEIVSALCGRRYGEGRVGTVGYAESHDQALVGDKTVAMWLFGAEIYTGMSLTHPPQDTAVVERGMALHKLITAVSAALGGEARMTFMGNEFGHPEWIDFPREGNGWSHLHARRQWSLADRQDLRYGQLLAWDRALNAADDAHRFVSSGVQWCTVIDDERQLLVAERGPLVWVFNFSPHRSWGAGGGEGSSSRLRVPAPQPGKYRVVLDSDATCFGGQGRVPWEDYYTTPAADAGGKGGQGGGGGGGGGGEFYGRAQWLEVVSPPRTALCLVRVREEVVGTNSGDGASEAVFPPRYAPAAVEEEGEAAETSAASTATATTKTKTATADAAAESKGEKKKEDDPPPPPPGGRDGGDYVVFRF